ncbi:hypothetical protein G7K_6560-t1 [Saitoella complicata NRRL Y-17804]|uniref:Uncharacterized protein n=1 Tax=Saitoella complicata (strain BCRC 22490 / CBS 7301 / JCM 7358 / NBRC 10748 / NRRL Y-17804) TaxID=698492 RepID=A0A0E9NSR3_SAICN|nr:hypothetical protein G7K_6560-t1 [Saitoella complicata NRRL Y-17804]
MPISTRRSLILPALSLERRALDVNSLQSPRLPVTPPITNFAAVGGERRCSSVSIVSSDWGERTTETETPGREEDELGTWTENEDTTLLKAYQSYLDNPVLAISIAPFWAGMPPPVVVSRVAKGVLSSSSSSRATASLANNNDPSSSTSTRRRRRTGETDLKTPITEAFPTALFMAVPAEEEDRPAYFDLALSPLDSGIGISPPTAAPSSSHSSLSGLEGDGWRHSLKDTRRRLLHLAALTYKKTQVVEEEETGSRLRVGVSAGALLHPSSASVNNESGDGTISEGPRSRRNPPNPLPNSPTRRPRKTHPRRRRRNQTRSSTTIDKSTGGAECVGGYVRV